MEAMLNNIQSIIQNNHSLAFLSVFIGGLISAASPERVNIGGMSAEEICAKGQKDEAKRTIQRHHVHLHTSSEENVGTPKNGLGTGKVN